MFLLFMIEFAYQNVVQITFDINSFYCMYDYNFEIRYEFENNFIQKKMSIAAKRIQRFQKFREQLSKR